MDLPVSNLIASAAYELAHDALIPPQQRIKAFIELLPKLGQDEVDLEESCPICLVPFGTLMGEQQEATAPAKNDISQINNTRTAGGVTKLPGCGHIFCRDDLIEWIRSHHGSCPTCRHTFMDIHPRSESDDESSDGGEYIPNLEDMEEEEEELFMGTDGFTDTSADEFPIEPMDLDFDEEENATPPDPEIFDQVIPDDVDVQELDFHEGSHTFEWSLTDGEPDLTSSEEDTSLEDFEEEERVAVALERGASISVYEGDDDFNPEVLPERDSK